MRKPKSLSYSAITQWRADRDEYYLRYLAPNRTDRSPQGHPASVGSAFDAYCKSLMNRHLFGTVDPQFEFETIFEKQVEPQNRDFARAAGFHAFDSYRGSGAYAELLAICETAIKPPRFEFSAEGEIAGVPLNGKPDLAAVLPGNVDFTHDWKVEGFCAKQGNTSPAKFHSFCSDGWGLLTAKASQGGNRPHKHFKPLEYAGITIYDGFLEDIRFDWPQQLSIYNWLAGVTPGDESAITSVHHVVSKSMGGCERVVGEKVTYDASKAPLVRTARIAARISGRFQLALLAEIQDIWNRIQTGAIFDSPFGRLSAEQQEARCRELDAMSARLVSATSEDKFFNSVTRTSGGFYR